MKKMLAMLVFAAMVCCSVFANDMDNWAEGVTPQKKNGVIVGFTCVGWGPKLGGMTASIAAKQAAAKAQSAARNAYSQYMSTQVQWKRNDKNEVVCTVKGSQQGDNKDTDVSTTESSYTDCSTEESEQFSQACISGLGVIKHGWNSDKVYVWVGGIDLSAIKTIKALARAKNQINAEVDDMGKAEKEKKAARDAKEIEAIKNGTDNANGNGGNGNGGNGRDLNDRRNLNDPKAGGTTPKDNFFD